MKFREPRRSMREIWGKPPSMPLTSGEMAFQYWIEAVVEILESGALEGSASVSQG
jgi:hypothetical protein